MSILSEEVRVRLKEIKKQILILEKFLDKAPEGRLRVSTNGTNARFYQIVRSGDVTGRYLRRSEKALAEKLAQKGYDRQILTLLREEERLLEKLEKYYSSAAMKNRRTSEKNGEVYKGREVYGGREEDFFFSGPEELIWKRIPEARRGLILPVFPDMASFTAEWLSEEYEKKEFQSTDAEFFTGSGIRVRSKTELIIADLLEKRNIPFYYERPLDLPGFGTIYPDFTVLNIKRRKTYYWEHMGMMDDEKYRDYALEKINHYIMAGHYPGIDLILTHETAKRPIRTHLLEQVIETYLET